jgi:hypothetical protein
MAACKSSMGAEASSRFSIKSRTGILYCREAVSSMAFFSCWMPLALRGFTAGQGIEKRGLPAVGISNQSNMDRFFYHSEVRKGSLCRIAVVYEIGSFLLRLRKIAG